MGSHYYEPNLNVEKQLESYHAQMEKSKKQLTKPNISFELRLYHQRNHKQAKACLEYLKLCQQEGIKYISIADLPLH